jgi:hypothetical protein
MTIAVVEAVVVIATIESTSVSSAGLLVIPE